MRNSNNSKKIIFNTAKKLFWTKGYSNVSVRDIAKQSKYDIALISRYFGSKKKLFEETLKDVAEWFVDVNPNNVVDFMVEGLMENSNPKDDVNLVRMLCMNSGDPEVGHIVKKFHREKMRKPVIDGIKKKIKPINYDLMGAILVGVSVARKTLDNPILSKLNDKEYEKVLRQLFNAALNYKN